MRVLACIIILIYKSLAFASSYTLTLTNNSSTNNNGYAKLQDAYYKCIDADKESDIQKFQAMPWIQYTTIYKNSIYAGNSDKILNYPVDNTKHCSHYATIFYFNKSGVKIGSCKLVWDTEKGKFGGSTTGQYNSSKVRCTVSNNNNGSIAYSN